MSPKRPSTTFPIHFFASKRRSVLLIGWVTLLSLSVLTYRQLQWTEWPAADGIPIPFPSIKASPTRHPPLYGEYHDLELRQPHQNWSRTRPDKHERFLWVPWHLAGAGWGNALEEHLMNAFLSWKAGRSHVFRNYTWRERETDGLYYIWNGHEIPTQIPYSAFIRGPTVGDPLPPGDNSPRAVTKDYFDHVCPEKVDVYREHTPSAGAMIKDWVDLLTSTDEPCLQTSKEVVAIFDHPNVFGQRRTVLEIWEEFSASPIVTHFGWSTLVEVGFDANRHLFLTNPSLEPYLASTPFITQAARYTLIPGLMVMHVRRGDYEWHCEGLANAAEDFITFNTFSDMPDVFVVPERARTERGKNDLEVREHYRRHCFPTVAEMAQKVRAVLDTPEARGVRRLYVMTNAPQDFLAELKAAMREVADWELIASNRDLVLSWEQKFIAQAIDQLVAQRAQVFIGNGFSTLTSHVAMMRKANGFPIASTRMW